MGELQLRMHALAVRKTPKPKISMPSDKLGKTPKRMMSMPSDMMGNADLLQSGSHPMVLNIMRRCHSDSIQKGDDTSAQAKVDLLSTGKPEDCLAAIFLA
jgi:hypothetical protein